MTQEERVLAAGSRVRAAIAERDAAYQRLYAARMEVESLERYAGMAKTRVDDAYAVLKETVENLDVPGSTETKPTVVDSIIVEEKLTEEEAAKIVSTMGNLGSGPHDPVDPIASGVVSHADYKKARKGK